MFGGNDTTQVVPGTTKGLEGRVGARETKEIEENLVKSTS